MALLVAATVMVLLAKRLGRKPAAPPPAAALPAVQQSEELTELVGQLDLLVKDVESTIDRRLAEVDQALLRADEALARLERATELAGQTAQITEAEAEAAGGPIWQPQKETAPPECHSQNEDVEEEFITLPGTWPLPAGKPDRAPAPSPASPVRLQSRRHAEVAKLRSDGLESVEIARKLQMDIGEVELILNLNTAQEPGQ